MNIRYMGDMALCNQSECPKAATCWRRQAMLRLAEDQDKDVPKPYRVTVFQPDPKTCCHFILDEYEERSE